MKAKRSLKVVDLDSIKGNLDNLLIAFYTSFIIFHQNLVRRSFKKEKGIHL